MAHGGQPAMAAAILMEIWHPDWKLVTLKSRRNVCDLERHPEWRRQQNWNSAELALEAGWLGLPSFGTCAQSLFNSSVPSCLTTFSSLWAPQHQKKPAKSKYFRKALQVIKRIKRLFLKGKIIYWDSTNHCGMVLAIAYTFAAMLVHQLKLKTRTELKLGACRLMRTLDSVGWAGTSTKCFQEESNKKMYIPLLINKHMQRSGVYVFPNWHALLTLSYLILSTHPQNHRSGRG